MKHTLAVVAVIGASAFFGCLMVDLPPAALRQAALLAPAPIPAHAPSPTGASASVTAPRAPGAPTLQVPNEAPAGNACSGHDGCFSKSCQMGSCEGTGEGEPCRTQRDCASDYACQAQICTLVISIG
jgi:hypothetical protein